jgi:hypothetical protein
MGTGGPFPGVKWPGREADHSPPTIAEIKKMWIYTSTPPYAFMASCLIKHRDNFTFLPYLAAGGAPVAVKRRAVEPVNKVKVLPVLGKKCVGGVTAII